VPPVSPPDARATTAQEKAAVLREALPWITRFHGATVVVKYGGNAMVDPELRRSFAADVALLHFVGLRPVVVHGGGPQIDAVSRRLGLEPRFVGGLRVTDAETMEVVRMVLLGQVNPELVGLIADAGAPAIGVAGTDALLLAAPAAVGPDGEDLGHVGEVDTVDPTVLQRVLDDGFVPVVATVARDASGDDRNVNADVAAGAIAAALRAEKLVYLTDVPGLYRDLGDEGSLLSEVASDHLAELLGSGSMHAGMRPKVASIVAALDRGVPQAHILDGRVEHALLLEVFTDEGVGTMVTATGTDAGADGGSRTTPTEAG
jgi:acetylglutamate kinase